jgi:hypothetical protein
VIDAVQLEAVHGEVDFAGVDEHHVLRGEAGHFG